MNELRKGQVEYGARAFDQDAGQAIRGDIIRALIELITNADDAYGQADGGITIRVLKTDDERTPTEIRIHDHAKGLDAEGLLRCFSVLGGEREADKTPQRGETDQAGAGRAREPDMRQRVAGKGLPAHHQEIAGNAGHHRDDAGGGEGVGHEFILEHQCACP